MTLPSRARLAAFLSLAAATGCSASSARVLAGNTDAGTVADAPAADVATPPDAQPPEGAAPTDASTPPEAATTVSVLYSQSNSSDPVFTYVLPNVDAVTTFLNWADVDQGPGADGGQYDWSATDARLELYVNAGKTVNLLVNPISYSAPDTYTPPYVMNDPNVQQVTCGNGATTSTIPIVYGASFKAAYKTFLAEVVQHFAGNASIGYARFGLSVGNEVYPQCAAEEAALMQLTVTTWGTQVWFPYDAEMLGYIESLRPTMKIVAPMTSYDGIALWTDTEAANAVAQGFGFGSQGLQKTDITKYPVCEGDWCHLFAKYAPELPTQNFELSTLDLSDPSGTCAPPACAAGQQATGPLPPLLTFAHAHHASTFELYPEDAMVAFVPTYPGHAQYGAAYAAAIAAVRGK